MPSIQDFGKYLAMFNVDVVQHLVFVLIIAQGRIFSGPARPWLYDHHKNQTD